MKDIPARRLVSFFILTFAFSWLLWLPQVLKFNGFPNLPEVVGLPGTFAPFGPALAAFYLTWKKGGKSAAKTLLKRGWSTAFHKGWLLPAMLLGPITALLTATILGSVQGSFSWEHGVPPAMIFPVFLMILLTNAIPEEFGWRGFALDLLQERNSAITASLILGVIWSLWHLPLFFIEGTTQAAIPMIEYFLQTIVLSILYTWLYNNTGGSLLVVILFHAVANTSAAVVPFWTSELGRWIDFGLLIATTGIVLSVWGTRHLSRKV